MFRQLWVYLFHGVLSLLNGSVPPPCFNTRVLVCFFLRIFLSGIQRNYLVLNYFHLSIGPDLITDVAAQGGSFVYFRLLEQTVEHNRKNYDLFSPGFALDSFTTGRVMLVFIFTFLF
jgi:hypothetical protein